MNEPGAVLQHKLRRHNTFSYAWWSTNIAIQQKAWRCHSFDERMMVFNQEGI